MLCRSPNSSRPRSTSSAWPPGRNTTVDRAAGPRLLPQPREQARRDVEQGLAITLDHFDTRAAGACARDAAVQARHPVGDERCDGSARVRRESSSCSPLAATPARASAPGFRLQWEPAQECHVLLYPKAWSGSTAALGDHEALRRQRTSPPSWRTWRRPSTPLARGDVQAFVEMASAKQRWLTWAERP